MFGSGSRKVAIEADSAQAFSHAEAEKQKGAAFRRLPQSVLWRGQYLVVRVFPFGSVVVVEVAFQPGPMIVRDRPLPVAL